MTIEFDVAALQAPVSRGDIRRFRASSRGGVSSRSSTAGTFTPFLVFCCFILLALPMVSWLVDWSGVRAIGPFGTVELFILTASAAAAIIGLTAICVIPRGRWRAWKRRLRLSRLAEANHFAYTMEASMPSSGYPSILFGVHQVNVLIDRFRVLRGDRLEIGNHRGVDRGVTGNASYSKTRGYVCVKLERAELDGVLQQGRGLRFEGAPLVFDVEVVDDLLFLRSSKAFAFEDSATWTDLQRVVRAIGGG
ncbi:hypothetical protein N1027_08515 [Herbiconiux sp. CPCC 205763]|uniref:Uncharacterized protein n=1 Tax=Herbiconiux aconitum TaxID=2970913 RepID=A0ABT2GPM5_9MICO|nr:hypothetical protein [Herbiconiux aconitum]MCS5718179.1 hypothetical protein [Herbiconiux aconitum]